MFREQSFPIHVGSYFAGVGTAVLVVIAGWLLLQTVPVTAPASLTSGRSDAPVSATMSTEIHPADHKLVDEGYLALLMSHGDVESPDNVHPADRKFFSDTYADNVAPFTGADPLSPVNPADRKFYTNDYVSAQ